MEIEDQKELHEVNKTDFEGFVPGSKDSYGKTIKRVIGKHHEMVVYITEDNAVGWVYHHLPEYLRPAIGEFQTLNGIARSCLSKKQLPVVISLLGSALYVGLLSATREEAIQHFDGVRRFIYAKATEYSRLAYVLLSMVFGCALELGLLLVCIQLGVAESVKEVLLIGAGGGITGSVISIMQRARDLRIDPLDSAILLGFHGFSRIVVGAIFGVLFLVAVKANIFLGHFADNTWALYGLTAGAGFSERWVPDFLGTNEK